MYTKTQFETRSQCLFVIPCTRQQWMDACKMMCCKCHWNKIPEQYTNIRSKTHIRPILLDEILPNIECKKKHEIRNRKTEKIRFCNT